MPPAHQMQSSSAFMHSAFVIRFLYSPFIQQGLRIRQGKQCQGDGWNITFFFPQGAITLYMCTWHIISGYDMLRYSKMYQQNLVWFLLIKYSLSETWLKPRLPDFSSKLPKANQLSASYSLARALVSILIKQHLPRKHTLISFVYFVV